MSDRAGLPGYDEWLSREPDWDDYETPEERAAAERRAEEPPDWYLEQEAERYAEIHRRKDHGGGECDCPGGRARVHRGGSVLMTGFDPDWTLAPSATLVEWMQENGLTRGMLAARCGQGEADVKAALIVRDVLNREPLLPSHAETLERGTGISAQFWLNYERIYRADLARGAKDTTPEGETP